MLSTNTPAQQSAEQQRVAALNSANSGKVFDAESALEQIQHLPPGTKAAAMDELAGGAGLRATYEKYCGSGYWSLAGNGSYNTANPGEQGTQDTAHLSQDCRTGMSRLGAMNRAARRLFGR